MTKGLSGWYCITWSCSSNFMKLSDCCQAKEWLDEPEFTFGVGWTGTCNKCGMHASFTDDNDRYQGISRTFTKTQRNIIAKHMQEEAEEE